MSDAQPISPQNSLGSLVSYRYQHSAGSIPRSFRTTTSFVTINHKRSFRPPPYILSSLVDYFPDRIPLSFATANPAVRLFTESSGIRGLGREHSVGSAAQSYANKSDRRDPRLGFVLDGFSVTMAPTEPFIAPCDEGGVVEDDTPMTQTVFPEAPRTAKQPREDNATKAVAKSEESPASLSVSSSSAAVAEADTACSPDSTVHIQAYPFHFAGSYLTPQTSPAEQHYYPFVGYDGVPEGLARRSRPSPAVVSGTINELYVGDGSGGGGGRNRYTHLDATRASPPPPATRGGSGPTHDALTAELGLCDERCWHNGVSDLTMCASLCCSSVKGLHMVLFSAWWLSRYYGISLTLKGFRQKEQVLVFKEIVRLLSVKELSCIRCVLSQEWMQTISSCNGLVSLSFVGCEADTDVPLTYLDSILTKQSRPTSRHQQTQMQRTLYAERPPAQSKWYLSGTLSTGLLRQLKCLHLVHTPVKQVFLEAVATNATSLECLVLHKTRGITSLDPLIELANLRSFSLQSSSLDDQGVEALGRCAKLQNLYIVECRRVQSLSFLRKDIASSLRRLTLSHNWFSEEHMRDVAACAQLLELHLVSLKRLTGVAPLSMLRDLEVLNVADTAVTVEGTLTAFQAMRLTRLNASYCSGLSAITGWIHQQSTTLTSLDLSNSSVDDNGLTGIGACAALRYLSLANCPHVTSIHSLRHLSGLRWLALHGTPVSGDSLSTGLNGPLARTLRYLSLHDCPNLRHLHFLRHFAGRTKKNDCQLRYLDLENTHVSDEETTLLAAIRSLEFLNMSRCSQLTDLSAMATLRQLRQLHVHHTGITNDGLVPIGECRSLEVVDLRSCPHLSVVVPLAQLPNLRELLLDSFGQHNKGAQASYTLLSAHASQRAFTPAPPEDVNTSYSNMTGEGRASARSARSAGSIARSRHHSSRSIASVGSASTATSILPSPRFGASNSACSGQGLRTAQSGSPTSSTGPDGDLAPFVLPSSYGSSPNVEKPYRAEMVELPALECLSCRKSALNEMGFLSLLSASTHLTHIDITECRYVTDLSGFEQLQGIREVVAVRCAQLNNGAVRTLASCALLERLTLTGCGELTDLCPLGQLRRLTELDASFTRVTDGGIASLGACTGLRTVRLSECRYLTSVNALGPLPFLRELHLESTSVTDAGVAGLASCACLQRLFLTKCKKITDVTELSGALKQLEVLDVYGTSIPTRVAGEPKSNACVVM